MKQCKSVCVCVRACVCVCVRETLNLRLHSFTIMLANELAPSFYRQKFWKANEELLNYLINLLHLLHPNTAEGNH